MEKNTAHYPVEGNGEIENGVSSSQNPETLCPVGGNGKIENGAGSRQNPGTLEHPVLLSTSQIVPNNFGIRKNYKRTANRGKQGSQGLTRQVYTLKSSDNDVRVLCSTSSSKTTPTEHVQTPVQPLAKRRKRSRASNKSSTDEFSQIRKRIRYILNRMNYEQSLIEAYACEGWRNQSLNKIKPEELERAKSEILRCKLRIREVFQNIDSLLSKGKIGESLFDSEGEISCEDIFCVTCGSNDATLGNVIILCDGACDRWFHQNCLNPPLRTDDIPMGDEGWLCPACDCKIYCIDLINDLQGSDLSIEDSWEKVFPEAAAMANGSKQDDAFDLPSDDLDDDPNIPDEHVVSKEEGSSEDEEDEDGGSDSNDSDFLTCSDDSKPLMVGGGKKHVRYWLGNNTLDMTATPTLSRIRARSMSSSPTIRSPPDTAQHQIEALQAELEEERRLREKMEAMVVSMMEAELQRMKAERQRMEAEQQRMEFDRQRMDQMCEYAQRLGAAIGVPLPPGLCARPPDVTTPNQSVASNDGPGHLEESPGSNIGPCHPQEST